MTKVVQALEANGLVRRERDARDGRGTRLAGNASWRKAGAAACGAWLRRCRGCRRPNVRFWRTRRRFWSG